ncbi:MepB family protein [Staphylococcus caledonicus]|uniref:MepB family protein n=1 Tax=Staphylococcus sp. acrmy TaxID=2929076 RepID=UPI001F58CA71|nr:MepB family protein [Staphylococcus sp. acrmy]MCI2947149.1 MepB family protein [Staphylococcus sp. acrmy]
MTTLESFVSYPLLKKKYTISKSSYEIEQWNREYEALTIYTNDGVVRSRLANKTPKKKGFFFALWTKDEHGKNRPLTSEELGIELVINIIDNHRKGQFIFPREVLTNKGILKSDNNKGKMALRVYPPWVTELNKSAIKTQQWQCKYFTEMTNI